MSELSPVCRGVYRSNLSRFVSPDELTYSVLISWGRRPWDKDATVDVITPLASGEAHDVATVYEGRADVREVQIVRSIQRAG